VQVPMRNTYGFTIDARSTTHESTAVDRAAGVSMLDESLIKPLGLTTVNGTSMDRHLHPET